MYLTVSPPPPQEERHLATLMVHRRDLLQCQTTLEEKLGKSPSVGQWASEAQLSVPELLKALREGSDARGALINAHLPLVFANAARVTGGRALKSLTKEDLVQEGLIGLLRAADKYELPASAGGGAEGRNAAAARFGTYASFWARSGMQRAMQQYDDIIRLPSHLHERLRSAMAQKRQMTISADGVEPSDAELAEAAGIAPGKLKQVFAAVSRTAGAPPTAGDELSMLLHSDEKAGARSVADGIAVSHDVGLALDGTLPPLEARAVRLRYGLHEDERAEKCDGRELTNKEVASIMGLSIEGVRLMVQRGLRKLRNSPLVDTLEEYAF